MLKTFVTCDVIDGASVLENGRAPRFRATWVLVSGWQFQLLLPPEGRSQPASLACPQAGMVEGTSLEALLWACHLQ